MGEGGGGGRSQSRGRGEGGARSVFRDGAQQQGGAEHSSSPCIVFVSVSVCLPLSLYLPPSLPLSLSVLTASPSSEAGHSSPLH